VPRRATEAPARFPSLKLEGPTEVVIYVPTQGASIGYALDDGPAAKWLLYTGPILVEGPLTLRAKAIRYGYKESVETRVTFTRF
jgi:N-sulfoglucosamine sulfohydrolase